MMIQSKLTFGLIAFVLVIYTGCQSKTAYQAPPPPKVTVVNPMVKNGSSIFGRKWTNGSGWAGRSPGTGAGNSKGNKISTRQ